MIDPNTQEKKSAALYTLESAAMTQARLKQAVHLPISPLQMFRRKDKRFGEKHEASPRNLPMHSYWLIISAPACIVAKSVMSRRAYLGEKRGISLQPDRRRRIRAASF